MTLENCWEQMQTQCICPTNHINVLLPIVHSVIQRRAVWVVLFIYFLFFFCLSGAHKSRCKLKLGQRVCRQEIPLCYQCAVRRNELKSCDCTVKDEMKCMFKSIFGLCAHVTWMWIFHSSDWTFVLKSRKRNKDGVHLQKQWATKIY